MPGSSRTRRILPLACLALPLTVGGAGCRSDAVTVEAAQRPTQPQDATEAQRIVSLAGNPKAQPDQRRRAMLKIIQSDAADQPVYLDFYRAVLDDPQTDATVASVCALALAEHGQPEDVHHLTPWLTRGDAFTRWQTGVALQRLHHPDAIAPLLEAMRSDEDADVRTAATVALGQYPRRDVFDALITTLDDRDSGPARAARGSLALMTGQNLGPEPQAWLDYANQHPGDLIQPLDYTYLPYPPGRGWWGLVFFWIDREASPQHPNGYPSAEGS